MTRLLLTLLALVMASPSFAQGDASYPDRPVRIVVPFPAGSATDIVSRLMAQKFSAKLGQQFIVENRPGASGNLGVDIVAKSAPDGYTIGLITASTHGVTPALGTKLPYDSINDFKPISMIGAAPYVLVLYPGIPAKSISELVALAKTKPGQLNYGSAGLASLAHLAAALFASDTGIELTHVPYKSSAQSSIDIITGRLDMQFATVGPTLENIRDGKLAALATTGGKRVSSLAGCADHDGGRRQGLRRGALDRLCHAGRNAGRDRRQAQPRDERYPERARHRREPAKAGLRAGRRPAAAVTERIRDETAKWRALVAKTGIKPE